MHCFPGRTFAAGLLAAALLGCGGGSGGGSSAAPGCGDALPVPLEDLAQRGPADAWVTLVEFGDYQCPFCRSAAAAVDRVVAAYPEDVRLVFAEFPLPFHARARPAALAAWCAGQQGAYWGMHDALFAPSAAALDDATLLAAAQGLGLDVAAWQACRTSAGAAAAVDAQVALGDRLCVQGTPTYAVNGAPLLGATEAELRAAVERARTRAIASGIPRASYYDKAVLGR